MTGERDDRQEATSDGSRGRRDRDLMAAARPALREFQQLTGLTPESVTGARPEGDGWSFLIDVTELERIPATSNVMATYRVDADRDGHISSYERLRRFPRNATDPT